MDEAKARDALRNALRTLDLESTTFGKLRKHLAELIGAPVEKTWLKDALASEATSSASSASTGASVAMEAYTQERMNRDHWVVTSLYSSRIPSEKRQRSSRASKQLAKEVISVEQLKHVLSCLPRKRGTTAEICAALEASDPALSRENSLVRRVEIALRSTAEFKHSNRRRSDGVDGAGAQEHDQPVWRVRKSDSNR